MPVVGACDMFFTVGLVLQRELVHPNRGRGCLISSYGAPEMYQIDSIKRGGAIP